jgi:hypothetical protein
MSVCGSYGMSVCVLRSVCVFWCVRTKGITSEVLKVKEHTEHLPKSLLRYTDRYVSPYPNGPH